MPGAAIAFTISRCRLRTISGGVAAGAKIAYHDPSSNPVRPDSEIVGTSGSRDDRLAEPIPSARRRFALMKGADAVMESQVMVMFPAMVSALAGPSPLYGTCNTFIPAIELNSSNPRCDELPTPEDA